MILSCPACATRYRHESLPVGSPARCSQCDLVFPVPPARSYFVLAVAPVGLATLLSSLFPFATIGEVPIGGVVPLLLFPAFGAASFRAL